MDRWQRRPAPIPPAVATTTVTYTYDPLYRLTRADYSDGRYFHYTYDPAGNRLSQTACVSAGNCATTTYAYDAANRLTSVNGQAYTWDANGNLINDGASTYAYDAANRLKSVTSGAATSSYAYNGLGDRVSQTTNSVTTTYVLDLNAGLTQVLSDGTNTYLYGAGRIGELQPAGFAYHLGDALGSVRQLADASGAVTLARSYEPYGSVLSSAGVGSSIFAFTGEQWDSQTQLLYLRARFYASGQGRFLTADTWAGDYLRPQTTNQYTYVSNNVINLTDPAGHCYPPLDWLRKVPPDDILCQYMDAAAFVWGAPMATPAEKALAATYIGGWAFAHSLLIVAAGLYVGGTAIAATELIPAVTTWATSSFTGWPAFSMGTTALAYEVATSRLANAVAVGGEAYLMYRGTACGDEIAQVALVSGYTVTGQSAVASTLAAANRLQPTTIIIRNSSQSAPAQVVRTIQRGESIDDIIDELKVLTYISGNEHAVVQLSNGYRAIVSGGPGGIDFPRGAITRLFVHTHPYHLTPTGPSQADIDALSEYGQVGSWLLEHGILIKFFVGR